jgi:hypothetical protein
MKWMLLLGALGAGAFAMWWLARERPGRPAASRTVAQAASAVLSLVLIVAAAYAAHGLGIFSLPLVVLAFLPFGIAARWVLLTTRGSRQRRGQQAIAVEADSWARFALPFMAVLAVAAAILGVIAGTVVGRN